MISIPAGLTRAARDWYHHPGEYRHRDLPVCYREAGDGTPLLLIHGFPTCSYDWIGQWPALSERYRCIAPDLLGFGCSAKPAGYPYSIHDQADLCEGLLRQCGVSEIHILAHDYGDTVAQELLARHIDRREAGDNTLRILSVCLLNGGLFPETHHARTVQKLLNSPLGALISRLMNRRGFGKGLAGVFGPDTQPEAALVDDFWALFCHNEGIRVGHLLIRYIRDRRQHRARWVNALQQANLPIRLINGPVDPVSGVHMTDRYRELIPDPDIVLLDGIGHYPQVEAPAAVLQAYLDFLDTHTL